MAKNTLVINSRFNPFSYADLVQPLRTATEQHQEVEAAYGELATAADMWSDIANNEKNSEAAALYSKYSDDLRKQADNLAIYGLNGNSRRELFNMKRRYASEIKPIEDAYNARVEDIKLQRELSAKDNSLVWNSPASAASIDSYLHGNRPEYYSVSGDDMYKRAATGAKAINDMFVTTEEKTAFNNTYFDLIERRGIPPETALQMMYRSGEFGVFDRLMDSLHSGSNYDKMSEEGKGKLDARIMEGIAAGLSYDEKHNLQRNYPYEKALDYSYSMALARNKAALAAAGTPASTGPGVTLNTQRLVSPNADMRKIRRGAEKFNANPIIEHFRTGAAPDTKINLSKALDRTRLMNGGHLRNKEGKNSFQVFDAQGNLLSEQDFLAQAGDEQTRRNLAKIRKDLVSDMDSVGDSRNLSGAFDGYNMVMEGSNPFQVEALEISLGKVGSNNSDALRRILTMTSNGKGIEEVERFTKEGLVGNGKQAKPEELQQAIKDGTITYHLVGDSILIRTPQKDFKISLEKYGSVGVDAIQQANRFFEYRDEMQRIAAERGVSLEELLAMYGGTASYERAAESLLETVARAMANGITAPTDNPWSISKKESGPEIDE